MAQTLSQIARAGWRSGVYGVSGPDVEVRSLTSNLWVSNDARAKAGAWLTNVGAEAARNVAITDLILDDGVRCRFRPFGRLEPGQSARIGTVLCDIRGRGRVEEATLAALISRTVVRRALAGDASGGRSLRWTLAITYEDATERRYITQCDIEVVELPLSLRAVSARLELGNDVFSSPEV